MAASSESSVHFTSFESKLDDYDISFVCKHIPLPIVNGIRRFSMNSIPIAGFRDDPPSVQEPHRSISIVQNHTLLYNEMLVTRISMLPLYQNKLPNILSKWDSEEGKRIYYWERPDEVPTVDFQITNKGQSPGLVDITTDSISDDYKELFVKDLVTKDPILIHSLMFPYPSIDIPFAFRATPVIGTGRDNSSFTPVGTTGMRFVEDDTRVEQVMKTWMENKALERASKGLTPLSDQELEIMRKNFYLLEKQRIYKQDETGPTHIKLRVESLGSMKSTDIIRETLRMIALHMCDLNTTLEESNISQEQSTVIVQLGKVDHTVAQCMVEAWKLLPITEEYTLPSYDLTHPLKETMRFQLRMVNPSVPLDTKKILSTMRLCIGMVIDDISYLLNEWNSLSKPTGSHNQTTFADPPEYWNWIESLPMTKVTLLKNRPMRTKWTIDRSLYRDGS